MTSVNFASVNQNCVSCVFIFYLKNKKQKTLIFRQLTSWTLARALHHCWSPKHLPIMRDSDWTLCCWDTVFHICPRHWAMAVIHRGSQMVTKCRIQTLQVVILLLRSSMECPYWKGTVGCNPKTRGLYYSQILGLPVWLHEPQGTVSILNRRTYHIHSGSH